MMNKPISEDAKPEWKGEMYDAKEERWKDWKGKRGDFVTGKVTDPNAPVFIHPALANLNKNSWLVSKSKTVTKEDKENQNLHENQKSWKENVD